MKGWKNYVQRLHKSSHIVGRKPSRKRGWVDGKKSARMVVEVDVVRAGSTESGLAQYLTGGEYSGTPQGILASQCCHWGEGRASVGAYEPVFDGQLAKKSGKSAKAVE